MAERTNYKSSRHSMNLPGATTSSEYTTAAPLVKHAAPPSATRMRPLPRSRTPALNKTITADIMSSYDPTVATVQQAAPPTATTMRPSSRRSKTPSRRSAAASEKVLTSPLGDITSLTSNATVLRPAGPLPETISEATTSPLDQRALQGTLKRMATIFDNDVTRVSKNQKSGTSVAAAAYPGWGGPSHGRPASSLRPSSHTPRHTGQQSGRVMTPRNLSTPTVGGSAIDAVTAKLLRLIVSGSATLALGTQWRRQGIQYQPDTSPYRWGIRADRGGPHGMLLCIQAVLLRYLVFKYDTKDDIYSRSVLRPSPSEKSEALVLALCDIIWRSAAPSQRGTKRAFICLPTNTAANFQTINGYTRDAFTENLSLYAFDTHEEVSRFMKRNVAYFQSADTGGCLLFLYSVVLSRTLQRVREDLSDSKASLLGEREECEQAVINLMLSGVATPHLHNGDIVYDNDGNLLERTMRGIPKRCVAGFLYWDKDEDDKHRTNVGSMLRTPLKPVWVTRVNGQYGLLLCRDPELVGNWRAEHSFGLHYYTGLPAQNKDVVLTIDTRYGRSALRGKSGKNKKEEEMKIPSLELCIMTKWPGCTVDWKGVVPFV